MSIKGRIFKVMQYECHPNSGESLLTEDQIKLCLAHKTIKRWAYICHDKDVYSKEDECENARHRAGTLKPRHWHIVIEMGSNEIEVDRISNWLKIQPQYIEVAKGYGAFIDCVEYLTHESAKEQEAGKYLYPDNEVKCSPGFDFREELTNKQLRELRKDKSFNKREKVRQAVLDGMRLSEVIDKYRDVYAKDFATLEKLRLRYISQIQPMPEQRINYYVEGPGGIGKGLISRAIAKTLVDPNGEMDDYDIFFEVGAGKANFEGYDGQPVIIWNDCRALTLIERLGGRENVFNVFDPRPSKAKQNIKYGAITLKNSINIVNSVESWKDFLDGLAGDYYDARGNFRKKEDKSQSYRRFPFFVVVHEEDYDLGVNKGIFEGTREYNQYIQYRGMVANFKRFQEKCGDNFELVDALSGRAIQPVREKYLEVKEKLSHPQLETDDAILAEFEDIGTQKGPTVVVSTL